MYLNCKNRIKIPISGIFLIAMIVFCGNNIAFGDKFDTMGYDKIQDKTGKVSGSYFHYDNGNSITVFTERGTFVYDKSSCGIKVYKSTQNPNPNNLIINNVGLTLQYADNLNGTWSQSTLNNVACNAVQVDNSTGYYISWTRTNLDGIWTTNYIFLKDKPFEYASSFQNLGNTHYYIITETQDGIPASVGVHGNGKNDPTSTQNSNKPIYKNINNLGKFSYGTNFSYSYADSLSKIYTVQYNIHGDSTQQIVNNFYSQKTLSNGKSFSFDPIFDVPTGSGSAITFDLNGIVLGSQITSVNMDFVISGNSQDSCVLRLIDPVLTEISVSNTFSCNGNMTIPFNTLGVYALQNNVAHPTTISISVKDNGTIIPVSSSTVHVNYNQPTYFARIVNGTVVSVIVADQSFVNNLGGTWIETKPDGSIRGNYAGIGDTYNATRDQFITHKVYPSWILDSNAQWVPPVPYPNDGQNHTWNETKVNWN